MLPEYFLRVSFNLKLEFKIRLSFNLILDRPSELESSTQTMIQNDQSVDQ